MLTKEKFLKDKINLHIKIPNEKIFWKVVDKLIELGFKPYDNNTRNNLWFAKYIFLYTDDASIHPRLTPDGKKEIPISDILGEESQFEVGKWYEIIATEFEPGEHISKFLKLKDGHFYYSEAIKFGDYSKHSDWHGYANWVREVSLEEIQQYLPGDHPDKLSKLLTIDDLVEGEVYFAECSKEEWNSLFYCKTPPRFIARLYISDKYNGKRYDPGDWGFTKGNKYRLATPEEKQWLNACISEGKFVEKEVALKDYNMHGKALKSEVNEIKQQFKVGDWVYADRQSDGDFRYELGDSYIPIFKVEEIYKPINKGEWLRPIKNKANGIESKYCRLATPEEIAKVNKPEVKQFDRNWYVKVDSQEEADKVFDWLESQGEKVGKGMYRTYRQNIDKLLYFFNENEFKFWAVNHSGALLKPTLIKKQLSDILPEYKQPIKTEEELSHIIDTNKELRNEIGNLINQRDFKSSDFAEPIIIKNKKQKRNKLIIVNN